MDLENQSTLIYEQFITGQLSRHEFVDAYDALYSRIPLNERNSIDRRIDRTKGYKGRSLGKFCLTLYDTTLREKTLIDRWVTHMLEINEFTELFIRDNGVDNSGAFILQVNSGESDYIAQAKGGTLLPEYEVPIECKFCPTFKKLTYKVGNLSSYLKSNSYVLTILSDRQLGGNGKPEHSGVIDFRPERMGWVLMSPNIIQKIMDEVPTKNYFEVGNKPAKQILAKDFDKYFTLRRFVEP